MQKYPNIEEFAEEWAIYLYDFPFLDLIVGITWCDEILNKRYEMRNINNWHEFDYLTCDDFCSLYRIMDCEKFFREKLGSPMFEELKKTIL